MALNIVEKMEGRVLEVTMTGKLTRADFQHFIPETNRLIKRHGKIRTLALMHDFHGWEAGALWEELKWDFKHFKDIERIALVGEQKWQATLSKLCPPFTTAEVRYFDHRDLNQARRWIESVGEPVTA
jgi:hypothetical protein